MENEGYLRMGKNICKVCADHFESGEILINKRLKPIKDDCTLTGWGLCPKHKKMFDNGYVALVSIDPDQSEIDFNGVVSLSGAHRTGVISHMKRDLFTKVFNAPIQDDLELMFVDDDVIEVIKNMKKQSVEEGA